MSDEKSKNRSIHPRVVGGKTVFKKVNTSKNKNPDTLKRVIEAIENYLVDNPRDTMSRDRLAKLNAKL